MSEFYLDAGPNAEYVRRYLYFRLLDKYNHLSKKDLSEIRKIIDKNVPDNLYFGTWQSYEAFGISHIIRDNIETAIKPVLALITLRKKFTPYIIHYLYKPKGMRYKNIQSTTLVGKQI